MKLTGVRRI